MDGNRYLPLRIRPVTTMHLPRKLRLDADSLEHLIGVLTIGAILLAAIVSACFVSTLLSHLQH